MSNKEAAKKLKGVCFEVLRGIIESETFDHGIELKLEAVDIFLRGGFYEEPCCGPDPLVCGLCDSKIEETIQSCIDTGEKKSPCHGKPA